MHNFLLCFRLHTIIVISVQIINKELENYSDALGSQEQWLVLNKMDLVPEDIRDELCQDVIDRLDWQGKVFRVSGQSGEECDDLCAQIMDYLDEYGFALIDEGYEDIYDIYSKENLAPRFITITKTTRCS